MKKGLKNKCEASIWKDWSENKMVKNSGIKITFCPSETFRCREKSSWYANEDGKGIFERERWSSFERIPRSIRPLSDVFDIRNWSLIAFDPFYEKNKKDKVFNEYMLEMRRKIEAGKECFSDLDEDVDWIHENDLRIQKRRIRYIEFGKKEGSYHRSMDVIEE